MLLAITHCCAKTAQTDALLRNIKDHGHDTVAEIVVFEDLPKGNLPDYPADTPHYHVRHAVDGPHGLTYLWNLAYRMWKFERPSAEVLLLSNNDVLYAPGCMASFLQIFREKRAVHEGTFALGALCFDKGCGGARHTTQNIARTFPSIPQQLLKELPDSLEQVQQEVNDPTVRATDGLADDAPVSKHMEGAAPLLGFSWAFSRDIFDSGFDFSAENLFNTSGAKNTCQEHELLLERKLPALVNTRCFVHHEKGITLSIKGVERDDTHAIHRIHGLAVYNKAGWVAANVGAWLYDVIRNVWRSIPR
eukprot:gnl/TRDRNA2_/TRDRNA2_138477_c0_seq2.p1 gnl/TRDRNA2_/TRDRNA2_138477_c0~~gnl/TRDRNA2_/TRDRNA2_138477_c0_seq2.p1  ORF type:complete len:305 (+),score=35.23 gnl/TRDRNA2_/TRDRNA2_138477_c0_seq2:26-940(+)